MFLTDKVSHSSLPPPEREVSTAGMANSTGEITASFSPPPSPCPTVAGLRVEGCRQEGKKDP